MGHHADLHTQSPQSFAKATKTRAVAELSAWVVDGRGLPLPEPHLYKCLLSCSDGILSSQSYAVCTHMCVYMHGQDGWKDGWMDEWI